MISDLKLLNKSNVSVVVNTTDSLRVMQLKNSNCGINNFNFKNLFFDLDQSSLWLKQSGKEKTPVRVVSMLVKNHSHVNCNDFQIDSMGIVFQNSQADFGISINKISGSLSDSSRVYIQHFDEIALKKDASSAINVND